MHLVQTRLLFLLPERFKILTIEGITKLFADSRANEYASNTLTVVNVEEIEFNTKQFTNTTNIDSTNYLVLFLMTEYKERVVTML